MLLLAVLAPIHVVTKLLLRRSPWPRRFLASAAWITGARTSVVGAPPRPGSLIVANHTSWLDIVVLGGVTGCAFVSKDQLGHSLIHWLADQGHTIYVNRAARRQVGEQAAAIASALERGEVVAFFPEGTVGPGDRLLPFRPPLFAAANSGKDFDVRPVAIDYAGRRRHQLVRRTGQAEHPESARAPRHPAGDGAPARAAARRRPQAACGASE